MKSVDPVDNPLETARHVEPPLRVERHRGRIHQARHQRLTRAVRTDAKNRDRHLLAPRSGIGHIQPAFRIHDRVVHLVQARRDHGPNLDVRLIPLGAVDVQTMRDSGKARRNRHREARDACGDHTNGVLAQTDLRPERFGGAESGAIDRDATPFTGRHRYDAGNGCGHGVSASSVPRRRLPRFDY